MYVFIVGGDVARSHGGGGSWRGPANSAGRRFIYISMRNAASLTLWHLFNWQLFLSREATEGKRRSRRLSLVHSPHRDTSNDIKWAFYFVSALDDDTPLTAKDGFSALTGSPRGAEPPSAAG